MNDYLKQTKFAASNLIELISTEENTLNSLESSLTALKKHHQFLYDDFTRKDLDPDDHFNDHQMMHAFVKQASFYQERIEPTQRKINEITFQMNFPDILLQLEKLGWGMII